MLAIGVFFGVSFAVVVTAVPFPGAIPRHDIWSTPTRRLSEARATDGDKKQLCKPLRETHDPIFDFETKYRSVVHAWSHAAIFGPGAIPVLSLTDQYGAAPLYYPLYIVADGGLNVTSAEVLQPLLTCFDNDARNRNISVVCAQDGNFKLDGCHREGNGDWYNPLTWTQWHWLCYAVVAACFGCCVGATPENESERELVAAIEGTTSCQIRARQFLAHTTLCGFCWGPMAYIVVWAATLMLLLMYYAVLILLFVLLLVLFTAGVILGLAMAVCLGLLLVYLGAHIGGIFLYLCCHMFCSKSFQEVVDANEGSSAQDTMCVRDGRPDDGTEAEATSRKPPTRADLTQLLMTPTTTVSGSSYTSGGRVARVIASVPVTVLAEAITVVEAQPVEVGGE
jgi:hypothetical protein